MDKYWNHYIDKVCDEFLGLAETEDASTGWLKAISDSYLGKQGILKKNMIPAAFHNASKNNATIEGLEEVLLNQIQDLFALSCTSHSIAPCTRSKVKALLDLSLGPFIQGLGNVCVRKQQDTKRTLVNVRI